MAGFKNDTLVATNVDFRGVQPNTPTVLADGQLLIGNAVTPNIRVGTLTSPLGTITIGYIAPNITIDVAGGGLPVDSVQVQAFTGPGTNPVLPNGLGLIFVNGAAVAAQTIPVRSNSLAANTYQIEVQRASSSVATNATQQGLSSYNSAHFLVDANGFVSNLNGLPASAFDVDAFTGPGTDPVLPNALGVVAVTGSQVAASTFPIRTNSLAANSYQIQVQRSSAQVASTLTANGICHFDSADFTVDANGFVSAIAAAFTWLESAGGLLLVQTGYFANAAAVYTLPAAPTIGEIVEIIDNIGGGVVVTANAGQTVRIQNTISGVGGTATSTQFGDALRLVYRAANTQWQCCPGAGGNWLLV